MFVMVFILVKMENTKFGRELIHMMRKAIKMPPEDLKRMQDIQLELLLEVDRICRKNHIKYCIIGGTLLGAVRHKGFIPWDDDIDVGMLRSEYLKFVEACKVDLNTEKYFLQEFSTDKYYRWGYSKILKNGTIYERDGQDALKMKKAIFADIFVYDGVPDNYVIERVHCFICFCVRKILWSPVGKLVSQNALLKIWYTVLSLIPRGFCIGIIQLLAKLCPGHKNEWLRSITFPVKYKRKWLTELTEMEFEGHMVYAPKDADEKLTYQYGDYMKLPPEEDRAGHNTAAYYYLGDK